MNKNSPRTNDDKESKTYLETEDIIKDIVFEEEDVSINENEQVSNMENENISFEDEPTQQRSMLDEIMNNSDNNVSFDENQDIYNQESFEETSTNFDIDENNPFISSDNNNNEEEVVNISFEDDESEDVIEDAFDEMQVSIEDEPDSQITYEE